MPKIALDEEEKSYIRTKNNMIKRMEERQLTSKMLAKELGINVETFRKKLNHPEKWSYEQLWYLVKRLHMTCTDVLEAFMIH